MAIILKANKGNLFVSSVLVVFWYTHSPNFLDTPRTYIACRVSSVAQQPKSGPNCLVEFASSHTVNGHRHTPGRTLNERSTRRSNSLLTQHTTNTRDEHPCSLSGIWSRESSNQGDANLHLRPHGYRERQLALHNMSRIVCYQRTCCEIQRLKLCGALLCEPVWRPGVAILERAEAAVSLWRTFVASLFQCV
jgi:hypothetical protein